MFRQLLPEELPMERLCKPAAYEIELVHKRELCEVDRIDSREAPVNEHDRLAD